MARYALIIGIAEYTGSLFKSLETPVQNANAIADILDQYGDFNQVNRLPFRREAGQKDLGKVIRKPLPNETLVRELQQFLQAADGSDVLIYYSGHGFTKLDQLSHTPEGYLAPSDCAVELNAAGQIVAEKNGISLFGLNTLINQHTFNSLVVILDCCNSGAFLESSMIRRDVTAFGYQRDYYLITACRSASKAYEGEEYSLLTAAVLKGLSPANVSPGSGRISGDRLFDMIGNELQNSRQEPIRMGWGRLITLVRYLQPPENAEPVAHSFNADNPYMGLKPFAREQADYFFGREQAVRALLDRLAENRFLAVIGPSGCGKSSLVKAGLLPELEGDRIPGSHDWQVEIITPGQYPLQVLTHALERHHADDKPVVLFVDQFEELFTLCPNEDEQRTFIKWLNEETNDPAKQTRIIVAMRGDFLDRCAKFQESADLINSTAPTTYMVTPLTEAKLVGDLEDSIICPANLHGVNFEQGLVSRIVEDVINQPGAMPLLQYALLQLWNNCISTNGVARLLTLQSYNAIDGVKGALQRWADQFYTNLSPTDQTFVRELISELVQIGDGGEVTRRRASWERLRSIASQEQLDRIIGSLVYQRLLVADDKTVEVAHEALLSESKLIQGWIEENRNSIRQQQHLEIYRREWQEHDRSENYLLDSGRLAAIDDWTEKKQPHLMPIDQEFIDRSRERRDQEKLAELEQAIQLQQLAEERQQEAERNLELEQQKSKLLRRNWLLISGLLAVISAAALSLSYLSKRTAIVAQEGEVNTLVTLAENYFKEDKQLEALVTSIKALDIVKRTGLSEDGYIQRIKPIVNNIQERNRWEAHPERIYTLSVNHATGSNSLNLPAFASGSTDGTIRLWNRKGGLFRTLDRQKKAIWTVTFSYNGKLLASTDDSKVRLWNTTTGKLEQTFLGHVGEAHDISFSADNTVLASSASDGTVKLWEIGGQRKEVNSLSAYKFLDRKEQKQGNYNIFGIHISPINKNLIAYGGDNDNYVNIWNVRDGKNIVIKIGKHELPVNQVKFSPNGLKIASSSSDGRIKIWSIASLKKPKLEAEIQAHARQLVYGLNFSKDGNTIVSGSDDQTIRIWKLDEVINAYRIKKQVVQESVALASLRGHTAPVVGTDFVDLNDEGKTLSERKLIVSASNDKTIRMWKWQMESPTQKPTNADSLLTYACSLASNISFENPLKGEVNLRCPQKFSSLY